MPKKTGFERLKQLLRSKPKDRAIRVDRTVLEDCLLETTAAVMKVKHLEGRANIAGSAKIASRCPECLNRGWTSDREEMTEIPCSCPVGRMLRASRE